MLEQPVTPGLQRRLTGTLFISESLFSASVIASFTLMPIVAQGLTGRDSLAGIPSTMMLIGQAAAGAPPIGPIDMAISPGMLVQLIGPSGSGKTTLAETLMRLHPPAGGNLRYAGISAGKVRIAAALERIALSPQFPAFLPGTLADQLRLAAPEATEADMRAALDVACASGFTPDDIAGSALTFDDVTMPYSGGELRRLGLARALLVSPQVLILDEPFAGLEADLARQLASNLAAWASGGERALILLGHKETRVPFPGMTTTVVHL